MKTLNYCHYCNGNLQKFWDKPRFDQCQDCDMLIRNPFPEEKDLNKLYTNAWEKPSDEMYEMGITNDLLSAQYVKEILKNTNQNDFSGEKILDFGAGKGSLMKALIAANADVTGIEPFGYNFLKSQGFNVYENLSQIPNDEKFDGIISMEVVEHLRKPWIELKLLQNILKPGGWLVVSWPNPYSFNARINKGKWNQANYPGHVIFPSKSTLIKILNDLEFSKANSLNWQIRYSDSILKSFSHKILQKIGFDGAARVIGWK